MNTTKPTYEELQHDLAGLILCQRSELYEVKHRDFVILVNHEDFATIAKNALTFKLDYRHEGVSGNFWKGFRIFAKRSGPMELFVKVPWRT